MSEEIRLLSGGSPKTAVVACVEAFVAADGVAISADFMTAPRIRAVMEGDSAAHPDVVVVPAALVETLTADGRLVAGAVARLGDVKAGVAVRRGAAHPDISSEEAVRDAILAAERVIYNEATSGAYIREMMERLGVAAEIESRTERLPSAGEAMKRLAEGKGTEIGFAQVAAIRRLAGEGIELVGPLPGALAHTTTYVAALAAASRHSDIVRRFLAFLATDEAHRLCVAAGVE